MKIIDTNQSSKTLLPPLQYGVAASPFGRVLLAFSKNQELYSLFFIPNINYEELLINELQQSFPIIQWKENNEDAAKLCQIIFSPDLEEKKNITLILYGTEFQRNVWKSLLKVPKGKTISYSELAHLAGVPKAVRAVASAVARNRISYLVPCHRIVQKSGKIGKYRWGSNLKRLILAQEKG